MVESNRVKKLARGHMREHPETTYQQALSHVLGDGTESVPPGTAKWLELVGADVGSDRREELRREAATRAGIQVPIGEAIGGDAPDETVWIDLAGCTLIVGQTGSGSSSTLVTALLGAAALYSPEKLQFVLVDLRGTFTFQPLLTLPHVAVSITGAEAHEGGLDALLGALHSEVLRRVEAQSHGAKLDDSFPTMIVALSDVPGPSIAALDAVRQAIAELAPLGRSLRIHLLVTSQRPRDLSTLVAHLNTAVCHGVSREEDSRLLFSTDSAVTLPHRGQALVGKPGGQSVRELQVFFTSSAHAKLADSLSEQPRPQYQMAGVDSQTRTASPLVAFDRFIGLDDVKAVVRGAVESNRVKREMRRRGADIPMNTPWFMFSGPPGVGKTTAMMATARALHLAGLCAGNPVRAADLITPASVPHRDGSTVIVDIDDGRVTHTVAQGLLQLTRSKLIGDAPAVIIACSDPSSVLGAVDGLEAALDAHVELERPSCDQLWELLQVEVKRSGMAVSDEGRDTFLAAARSAFEPDRDGQLMIDRLGNSHFVTDVLRRAQQSVADRFSGTDLARVTAEQLLLITAGDIQVAVDELTAAVT